MIIILLNYLKKVFSYSLNIAYIYTCILRSYRQIMWTFTNESFTAFQWKLLVRFKYLIFKSRHYISLSIGSAWGLILHRLCDSTGFDYFPRSAFQIERRLLLTHIASTIDNSPQILKVFLLDLQYNIFCDRLL